MRLRSIIFPALAYPLILLLPPVSVQAAFRNDTVAAARAERSGRTDGSGQQGAALPSQPVNSSNLAAPQTQRSGVVMHVDAGWAGRYRDAPAWTPVRVTLRNATDTSIGGFLQIRDDALGATVGSQSLVANYEQSVILPPGSSKQVSLYIPGADVGPSVNVEFRNGHRLLASSSSFPAKFLPGDITAGVFTRDASNTQWLNQLRLRSGHRLIPVLLSSASFDPVPEVLAAFDVIVLTDADTSTLDRDQLVALDRYVRNGGSLLEVGGPDWAATLNPLPGSLVPGRATSSQSVRGLATFHAVRGSRPLKGTTTLSVLTQPKGPVLLSQNGLPVIVRSLLGNGIIEYWAFDPSIAPLLHWKSAAPLLGQLTSEAIPAAMRRVSLPTGYDSATFLGPPPGPLSINDDLASIPASSLRTIILIVLVLLYALISGPLLILALRRLRRSGWTWAALPAVALIFTTGTAGVASSVRSSSSVVKAVGMLEMDGAGDRYPLDLYTEVASPGGPSHRLTYDAPALVQPELGDNGFSLDTQRSVWSFREGTTTSIGFSSNGVAGSNTFSMRTSAPVGGAIQTDLHLDSSGAITGMVQNETGLTLIRPAIVAGRAFERLPDMRPGVLVSVRFFPQNNPHHHVYPQTLFRVYGNAGGDATASSRAAQNSNNKGIQNALAALPETNIVSMFGEVSLISWTEQPVGRLQLDDQSQNSGQLMMIVKPLKVKGRRGPFRLRRGTVGAYLVDQTPAVARYPCCSPTPYGVYIGNGGDATFQFDLPATPLTHFKSLTFSIYGGGPDASYTGYTGMARGAAEAYDWLEQRWIPLLFHHDDASLQHPDRFISSSGSLLVRLLVRSDSNELTITDPRQDLQISGTAGVG